jgi:hypothetical protein
MTLEQALEAFNVEFSGWWWTLGECHVSCDASIAPDRRGPDADLLDHRSFDDGFHVDLLQPSTVADALLAAMELARKARADCRAGPPLPDPAPLLAPRLSVLFGFKRAAVAVAHKLAVIMHTMLKNGELFNPNAGSAA